MKIIDGFSCKTEEHEDRVQNELLFINNQMNRLGMSPPKIPRNQRPQYYTLHNSENVLNIKVSIVLYCKQHYKNIKTDVLEFVFKKVHAQNHTKTMSDALYRLRCIDDNGREWIIPCFAKSIQGATERYIKKTNAQKVTKEQIADAMELSGDTKQCIMYLAMTHGLTKQEATDLINSFLER